MIETEARNTMLAHGVPQAVLDVWQGKFSRSPLCFRCGKPNFRVAEGLEKRVPGLHGLVPIFDQNGDALIGFLPRRNSFVRFYYEDARLGDGEIEVMGIGYQQFAGTLLLEFEEAGLSEYFDDLVTVLQFTRGDELRALLDAEPYDDDAVHGFHSRLALGKTDT
jgi:hypothetical protein